MTAVAQTVGDRLASVDWAGLETSLEAQGFAALPALLDPDECASLARLYPQDARFRSRIDMSRFRFGVGEYKYFAARFRRRCSRCARSSTRGSRRSRTAGRSDLAGNLKSAL